MKQIRAGFIVLIFAFVAISCSSDISKQGSLFLWEVKSDNATVYLLGSVHLAKQSLYPLDSAIENAFARSDYIVVEADISKADPASLAGLLMYGDERTLESEAGPELFAKFKERFDKTGIPSAVYNKLKPWAATIMLQFSELSGEGYSQQHGIDMYFLEKAGDKPLLELESIEEQIEFLEVFDEYPEVFLDYTLGEQGKSIDELDELFAAWKAGDAQRMEEIIDESFEGYEEIRRVLLGERNIDMAKKIEGYLGGEDKYFVIAGAAHLVGRNGIISLLGKTGRYSIVQR